MITDQGELWSFFRRLIDQGTAIQQDYAAGRFKCYEEFSSRLDEAARERVREFIGTTVQPPAAGFEEAPALSPEARQAFRAAVQEIDGVNLREVERLRGLLRKTRDSLLPDLGCEVDAALAGTSESAADRSVATTTADQPPAARVCPHYDMVIAPDSLGCPDCAAEATTDNGDATRG